jgi:membrane protease YdiL (CAAX protease family)
MRQSKLRALGLAVGLFVAVYAPAFVVTALVRPRIELAIPLVIAISFAIALILILLLARRKTSIAEFGLKISNVRWTAIAIAFGLCVGLTATFLTHLFPSKPPFDVSRLSLWMIALYFIIGSSIQEEVIFRGLIQTVLERQMSNFAFFRHSLSCAVIYAAVLFGVIHLESGILVATGAFVLGLVAGELRRRSGSLVPAIIVHALFNAADAFWSYN